MKLKNKKINLVGHDFGSYVASYFCLFYPKLVKSTGFNEYAFWWYKNKKIF